MRFTYKQNDTTLQMTNTNVAIPIVSAISTNFDDNPSICKIPTLVSQRYELLRILLAADVLQIYVILCKVTEAVVRKNNNCRILYRIAAGPFNMSNTSFAIQSLFMFHNASPTQYQLFMVHLVFVEYTEQPLDVEA